MANATVLIVEDEPLIAQLAREEFEDAGYDTLAAANGEDAIRLLAAAVRIDLLFTDIRLPGSLDGWSIAERARGLHPTLPVIYATGYADEAPRVVEGGRMFRKPYRFAEILSVAAALIAP